jgi:hypothetical protein
LCDTVSEKKNFPNRLIVSGHRRTKTFIHFLFENYTICGLIEVTGRCVTTSGLEALISYTIEGERSYGIFQRYLHRNLLWHRSNEKKTKRIGYEPGIVPSWSWIAYGGGIQFMEIPIGDMDWNDKVQFNKERTHMFSNIFDIFKRRGRHALVTDIGTF